MNESRTDFSVLPGAAVQSASSVQEFARIAAIMNRLLSHLSNIPLFKRAELGLSEWIALTVLQASQGINNKQLASRLGVTRQRAHQIINKLEAADLIAVEVSPQDSRENIIWLAKNGEKQLETVNAELSLLLTETLGPQSERLTKLRKQLFGLHKALRQTIATPPAKQSEPAQSSLVSRPKGLHGLMARARASLSRGA